MTLESERDYWWFTAALLLAAAVSWFGDGQELKADRDNGDLLNMFINKFVVGD